MLSVATFQKRLFFIRDRKIIRHRGNRIPQILDELQLLFFRKLLNLRQFLERHDRILTEKTPHNKGD